MLAYVLLNYDIKMANDDGRPSELWFGVTSIPDPTAQLMFCKRTWGLCPTASDHLCWNIACMYALVWVQKKMTYNCARSGYTHDFNFQCLVGIGTFLGLSRNSNIRNLPSTEWRNLRCQDRGDELRNDVCSARAVVDGLLSRLAGPNY